MPVPNGDDVRLRDSSMDWAMCMGFETSEIEACFINNAVARLKRSSRSAADRKSVKDGG